jgi:hypothetical protein
MSNAFYDKYKTKLGVAASPAPAAAAAPPPVPPPSALSALAPHAAPAKPAAVPAAEPPPVAIEDTIASRCVLPRPLTQQPKASKHVVCKPVYDASGEVTRLGIQLSAGDGVPCAFYHSQKKRLIMGVTLLFDLDAAGKVQTLNFNTKDPKGKDAIANAEQALQTAFEAHGADADLTTSRC